MRKTMGNFLKNLMVSHGFPQLMMAAIFPSLGTCDFSGLDYGELMSRIEDVIIKTLIAAEPIASETAHGTTSYAP